MRHSETKVPMNTTIMNNLIEASRGRRRCFRQAGFTLVEAVIASAVVGISFASLYSGLVQGDSIIQADQLNMRASQIMEQQMETIRLYTWNQITNTGYIPASNTYSFYPASMTNQSAGVGTTFYESTTITNSGLSESYSNDLRQVIVTVTWNWNAGQHQRQTTTYVSSYGMQDYIYQ